MFSVNTERFIADGAGNVRAAAHEVRCVRALREDEGTDFERPVNRVARWACRPERGPMLDQLGVEPMPTATSTVTPASRRRWKACVRYMGAASHRGAIAEGRRAPRQSTNG